MIETVDLEFTARSMAMEMGKDRTVTVGAAEWVRTDLADLVAWVACAGGSKDSSESSTATSLSLDQVGKPRRNASLEAQSLQ
jgi:hypothetical protein